MMRSPQLMIRSPEMIKEVLVKSFNHFQDNEFFDFVSLCFDLIYLTIATPRDLSQSGFFFILF